MTHTRRRPPLGRPGTARLTAAAAAAALLAPLPAAAAAGMTLGPVARTALPGCDNPTPVRGPDGAVYSNVSDCSPAGTRVSTAWERLDPTAGFVASNVTTGGSGASGKKLSSAVVDGGVLYLLERNLTTAGGMRLGWSAGIAKPGVTWAAWTVPDFGWGSFAQASPDGYQYVYLRDSKSAYGTADRVDLVRVPKGKVADLAAWQVFAGGPAAPAWLPWADRAGRKPVLTDPARINRPHASYLGGCWTMAVTMPPTSAGQRGGGLAVYTSLHPYGPWTRRYYVAGVDLGESAQLSPLWPGQLLLTEGDRFEWRGYAMPSGC